MSYYGVRKVKTIKNEEGKYNISCEYYDSSITDWRGRRVWNVCSTGFFTKWYDTKEELEYALFQDTLDGNLHGTGGKYACIGWGTGKVTLSEEEQKKLKELEDKKWSSLYNKEFNKLEEELRSKGIEYDDMEKVSPVYKEYVEARRKASKEYSDYRYNTYFKRWKEFLEQKKINNRKENKKIYIVRVDYNGYHDIFISSHGSRCTKFTNYFDNAKLFTCTKEELKEMFCGEDYRSKKYGSVKLIDVTNFIKGKGKNRRADISIEDVKANTIVLK